MGFTSETMTPITAKIAQASSANHATVTTSKT